MTSTNIPDPDSGELAAALRRLKLGKMLDTLGDRLALANQQQLSHVGFLEFVLADEATRRETNSAHLRPGISGPVSGRV